MSLTSRHARRCAAEFWPNTKPAHFAFRFEWKTTQLFFLSLIESFTMERRPMIPDTPTTRAVRSKTLETFYSRDSGRECTRTSFYCCLMPRAESESLIFSSELRWMYGLSLGNSIRKKKANYVWALFEALVLGWFYWSCWWVSRLNQQSRVPLEWRGEPSFPGARQEAISLRSMTKNGRFQNEFKLRGRLLRGIQGFLLQLWLYAF